MYASVLFAAPRSVAAWILLLSLAACSGPALPTQPSAAVAVPARVVSLEAEVGTGDGQIKERSRASGGLTIHLAPGERRVLTFAVSAPRAEYALSVTYSNGQEGENEVLTVTVDGALVSSFQNRDSGDATEGWNIFVTDPAGTSDLRSGSHVLVLESRGGDGCVEIDFVTLSPT